MRQVRCSNIELLRIIASLSVIILHFNFNPAGGGAVEYVSGVEYWFLMVLESIGICAVNVFILISGYFTLKSDKIELGKLLKLLLQTIVFSFSIELFISIVHGSFSIKQLVLSLLPTNYYVILYIALMCVAPFINIIISQLGDRSLRYFVIVLMFLGSVWPTLVDMLEEISGHEFMGLSTVSLFGSGKGYTIINFMLVYVIGAYIRKCGLMEENTTKRLLTLLIFQIIAIAVWEKVLSDTAWQYSNPIVIFEAVSVFLLFKRIRLSSKFINRIATASFTSYLIHEQLLNCIDYSVLQNVSLPVLIMFIIAILVVIYMISIACTFIWNKISAVLFDRWNDRIPVFIVR